MIGQSVVENNRTLLTDEDVDFILTNEGDGGTFISDNFAGIY